MHENDAVEVSSTRYASALRASEQVAWRLDDVLTEEARLGFDEPFLPEALAGTHELSFLGADERRTLNHVRAHGYLCTFGLVEEFILPFVLERLRERVDADTHETRALLAFATEEAKHIELFQRFRRVFERGFGQRCEVIGPAQAIRQQVLSHGELGVGLLILHIEWMTQRHYLDMVREDGSLEVSFRRLLHKHWLEECQHARIDGWIVERVAAAASPEQRAAAVRDYVTLLELLDAGLTAQVDLDLEALERAIGRTLPGSERDRFRDVQRRAQRRTYLGAGVSHPRLRAAVLAAHPEASTTLDELTRRYSVA